MLNAIIKNKNDLKSRTFAGKSASLILTLLLFGAAWNTRATDRLVAEGGAGGAYANIIDAVNAAVSGDRILITPKAGGATWNENLTMTSGPNNAKSLQFLSATEGVYWKLNGSISYTPAAVGQSLTIMGAHITNGDITCGASAPAGTRCKVTIMGCKLTSGVINFNFNYYDVNIAGDSLLNGYIYFRYGKVMGNFVDAGSSCVHGIYCNADAVSTDDYVYIVGNKIDCTTNGCTAHGIYWLSGSQFYYIANNYIYQNGVSQNCIRMADNKNSAVKKNFIINNTLKHSNTSNCIYTDEAQSVNVMMNNAVHANGVSSFGIASAVNSINNWVSYNYFQVANGIGTNITDDGTNQLGVAFTYDASTGEVLTGTPVNGGTTDLQYSDLDLSRNDAGCFGGSWSRENFLGGNMTSTQVTFFDAPGRVLAGNTINITGEGFDK